MNKAIAAGCALMAIANAATGEWLTAALLLAMATQSMAMDAQDRLVDATARRHAREIDATRRWRPHRAPTLRDASGEA